MNRQAQIDRFLLLAHEAVSQRMLAQPAIVIELRQQLARARAASLSNRSDSLWDEWEQWLAMPVAQLAQRMCERSDRADELRSVSPISIIINQVERAAWLKQARDAL